MENLSKDSGRQQPNITTLKCSQTLASLFEFKACCKMGPLFPSSLVQGSGEIAILNSIGLR
jgi:hypothetical protein